MPDMARTSVRELTDRLLDGGLFDYLTEQRDGGTSFNDIAFDLRTEHDVFVTGETVRTWCRDLSVPEPDTAA